MKKLFLSLIVGMLAFTTLLCPGKKGGENAEVPAEQEATEATETPEATEVPAGGTEVQ